MRLTLHTFDSRFPLSRDFEQSNSFLAFVVHDVKSNTCCGLPNGTRVWLEARWSKTTSTPDSPGLYNMDLLFAVTLLVGSVQAFRVCPSVMLITVGPSPHVLSSYGTAREAACRDMCAGEEFCKESFVFCVVGPSPHMLSSCGTAREEACRDMCLVLGKWVFMVHVPG